MHNKVKGTRMRSLQQMSWLAGALLVVSAGAQAAPAKGGKTDASSVAYTCTDASGRRITSDRPIPACLDREQRMISSTGTVRVVPPQQTAVERQAQDARKREQELAQRQQEREQRRASTLINRYPTPASYEAARTQDQAAAKIRRDEAQARVQELQTTLKPLETEIAAFGKDPAKVPAALRNRAKRLHDDINLQQSVVKQEQSEIDRINVRYDTDLPVLKAEWAKRAGSTAAASKP